MITCMPEDAGKFVCPMVLRSCAGSRCMAWTESKDEAAEKDAGFCGMAPSAQPVTITLPASDSVQISPQAEPQESGGKRHRQQK